MWRFVKRTVACAAVLLLASACGGPAGRSYASPPPAADAINGEPRIVLNHLSSGMDVVDVVGVPADLLSRLRQTPPSRDQWASLLRVTVDGAADEPSGPGMLGSYSVIDTGLRFTPQFSFDPGQAYSVAFSPSSSRSVKTTIQIPRQEHQPSTRVVEVYPTAPEIPENQLRMYIAFSASMGLKGALEHIELIDETGERVEDPFLPLDVDLWDETRTRFTLLFDPGRVKRGILPNEKMGRSLTSGRRYTLAINPDWRDAAGQPLASAFRREFRVGPPAERALSPAEWRVDPPVEHTREPLSVSFPRPLDYALLRRALTVSRASGERLEGEIRVERGETRWLFTPREPWRGGDHQLLVASTLEDGAGNRIGRAFEVSAQAKPGAQQPQSVVLPFQTRSAR